MSNVDGLAPAHICLLER